MTKNVQLEIEWVCLLVDFAFELRFVLITDVFSAVRSVQKLGADIESSLGGFWRKTVYKSNINIVQ